VRETRGWAASSTALGWDYEIVLAENGRATARRTPCARSRGRIRRVRWFHEEQPTTGAPEARNPPSARPGW